MWKSLRRLLALAVATVPIGWGTGVAFGQSLSASPPVVTLDVNPGDQVTRTVDLASSAKNDYQLNVYLSDWSLNQDGGIYYQKPGTLPASSCPWVTFSPATALIKAGKTVTARYTVQVPANAKPGTHWCVLFFDGAPAKAPPPGVNLATFRIRVGETLYINVEPLDEKGAVAGMFTQPPTKTGDPYMLVVQYANPGNQVQWVQGKVELRNAQGDVIRTVPVKGFASLPGAPRNIKVAFYGPLPAGTYAALAVFDYGNAVTQVAGQATFTLKEPLAAPASGGANKK